MGTALYGPAGFYTTGEPPSRHFRTSVHVSARFAEAILMLVEEVDAMLGHPGRLDVVDIGAGRGELLSQVLEGCATDPALAGRVAAHAVEIAPRPHALNPRIGWTSMPPDQIRGLVIANEWLDNIPLDVVELTADGPRLVLVDPVTGAQRPGPAPGAADLAWLRRWWPLRLPGDRAEIGWSRCRAWARLIRRTRRGLAIAVDYGHGREDRPRQGTLTGYQFGRRVRAVPDGSRDITAHVALDACAQAGLTAGAQASLLTTQRAALLALGVNGRRPPLVHAAADPHGYARALQQASADAELIDRSGLGGFGWLAQSAGMGIPPSLARSAPAG